MRDKNDTDTLQIETLFHRALEVDVNQQSDFIARECRGNIKLRHQVESLIASARSQGVFDIEGPSGLKITTKQSEQEIALIKAFMNIIQQTDTS